MKLLLLLRGAPGVGKSTIANALLCWKNNTKVSCFAADDYFYNQYGDYLFVPEMLPRAHSLCFDNTEDALQKGKSLVIVHNTFCKEDDMKQYYHLAEKYNVLCSSVIVEGRRYHVKRHPNKVSEVGEFMNRDKCDIESIHNVPEVTVNRMIKELKGSILL